jgi:hypothetical protein
MHEGWSIPKYPPWEPPDIFPEVDFRVWETLKQKSVHIPRRNRPHPAHYTAHVFCQLELKPPHKLSNSCIAYDPYLQGILTYS